MKNLFSVMSAFEYKNSILSVVDNKIDYELIFDNIPYSVSFWGLDENDFSLIYLNKAAKEKKPELLLGIKLSNALPEEYDKFFYSALDPNRERSNNQISINKNLLLLLDSQITNAMPENLNDSKLEQLKNVVQYSPASTKQLGNNENLIELGKMLTFALHEIKTPLTSIKINVDILERNNSIDRKAKESIRIMKTEINRLTKLLKNILLFSNYPHSTFEEVILYEKIKNIKLLLEPLLNEKKIALFNKTLKVSLLADSKQLQSLFLLLIENSIEAIKENGKIEITSQLKDNKCHIYIKDNGCGLNYSEDIFKPFISSKSYGTGLGLAIAKNIVDNHNGMIRLFSSEPGKTIFEIILPTVRKDNGKNINN